MSLNDYKKYLDRGLKPWIKDNSIWSWFLNMGGTAIESIIEGIKPLALGLLRLVFIAFLPLLWLPTVIWGYYYERKRCEYKIQECNDHMNAMFPDKKKSNR
jgi:hypothetical protein